MAKGIHRDRYEEIRAGIASYEADHGNLPGLATEARRESLCKQVISSLRRIEWVMRIKQGDISPERGNPFSNLFDPIRAAVLHMRNGDYDQAVWMTFIQTHFGKHHSDGWKLSANVYGSFGSGPVWTYENYRTYQAEFEEMLQINSMRLRDRALSGSFSNHRKFQSKKPHIIARTFSTFFDWQSEFGGLDHRVREIHRISGQEPTSTFDALYRSMTSVHGFGNGRLGRFDFLTMIGKLDLAPIVPGSVYLNGATGPYLGACKLFANDVNAPPTRLVLQEKLDTLDEYLNVGKQVIEDSICNWQKSPDTFVYFKG